MHVAVALLLAATQPNCGLAVEEVTRQLSLPYDRFDAASGRTAWRSLNASGCVDSAVEILQRYGDVNAARLSAEQRSELAFHRGQALAFGGREAEAVPHFEEALRSGESEEWKTYVIATLAFLRRDLAQLHEARLRYSAIAPGSMREKFVIGLEACPTKSYMTAVHCAM